MSEKLLIIRKKIDTLDNQIHDLLMKRAELIDDICYEKRKSNKPVVQPAREAMMIRRLLARHKGLLPQAAIVGIWRELVGAVCMLQKGLHVHVVSGEGLDHCWDAAKDYFGSVLPMTRCSAAAQAIALVREDNANISVVPWVQDGEEYPWWVLLMNQEPAAGDIPIKIVCALPYGTSEDLQQSANKSLIVSKIDYAASGQDRSFIAIEISSDVSRARILEAFKKRHIEAIGAVSHKDSDVLDRTSHLFEIDAFITDNDPRLAQISEEFELHAANVMVLGGYPVPPIFREGDTDAVGSRAAKGKAVRSR